jgi:hypothetical protein
MALIGISGRLGSGKDTVGSIIQYLDLCKKANKTNLSYNEYINSSEWINDWKIKKFAGKLKAVGSLLTGIPIEMFEDQEFKKTDLPNEWVYIENGYAAKNMTVRDFLQKLGTEAMRDGLHTNVWVNALFADYKPTKIIYNLKLRSGKTEYYGEIPNWIITDMRFPNELRAVKEKGGITIRVNRPKPKEMFLMNTNNVIDTRVPEHPSETALDDAKFDYVIENDGTLDELVEKVRAILIREKIIS